MLNKIRIKPCPRHSWHSFIMAPNPDYYTSYETKFGTTIFMCKDCHERITRNLAYGKELLKERREKEKQEAKDKLLDTYVIKELLKGTKGVKRDKIPKALIEMKRTQLLLNKVIKKKTDPIIECPTHGDLYLKDVIKAGKSRYTGIQNYKCRVCHQQIKKEYYKRNKEYVLAKCQEYKNKNPEKIREIKNASKRKMFAIDAEKYRKKRDKYDKNNPEKKRARQKRFQRNAIENLTDSYVKQQIVRNTDLKHKDIPQPVVEMSRDIMKLKRFIKYSKCKGEIENGENNKHENVARESSTSN